MEVALVNVYKPKTSVVNGKIVHDYSITLPHSKTASSHSKSSTETAYLKAHQSSNGSHRAKSPSGPRLRPPAQTRRNTRKTNL